VNDILFAQKVLEIAVACHASAKKKEIVFL